MRAFLLAVAIMLVMTMVACGPNKQKNFKVCDVPSTFSEVCSCAAHSDKLGKIYVDIQCAAREDDRQQRRTIVRLEE